MKHQNMLMQFEKLPFLIMNFICNPKSSLTPAERSTFTFLFTSVALGEKKYQATKSMNTDAHQYTSVFKYTGL